MFNNCCLFLLTNNHREKGVCHGKALSQVKETDILHTALSRDPPDISIMTVVCEVGFRVVFNPILHPLIIATLLLFAVIVELLIFKENTGLEREV